MNKQKPDMKFWGLWNLSFGFFGVQIAYALQSANVSRIFATLGADPHSLNYFWVLPPLMGIIVQPIVGTLSDRTWTRFGRRIPYLFIGAALAVLVMCLLPNAGSFGLAVGAVMVFGLVALMFLDTSLNMAMQPFKMLVGDMVNEKQKAKAYSIQSFLCNAGSVVGFVFPFLFTWLGIRNVAVAGEVPDSVKWSFYIGAAILILCVVYTALKVREWNPREYAEYNPVSEAKEEKADWITLLGMLPPPSGRWGWCSFSAGQACCICGTTPPELLPRPCGTPPMPARQPFRRRATGWESSLPCRPWAAWYGRLCFPVSRIPRWPIR